VIFFLKHKSFFETQKAQKFTIGDKFIQSVKVVDTF